MQKRKSSLTIILLGIILISFLTGWTGNKNDDPVVAKIGDNPITLAEFNVAYMHLIKQPKMFDSKKLRESFLDELIQGKILSLEAKRLNFDKNEFLEYKINSYRDKCLREEHFQKVIKPMIHIEEKDIEEAYLYTQEERRISHLFFQSKSVADSFYYQLEKGFSFDSLAKIVFADTLLANHGGNLGWVSWDQLEYEMATAAFRMKVNTFSPPIRSIYGYHIIKVTGFKKKPMISRQQYEIHRRKAKYLLEFKIGDKLAFEYNVKMIKSSKILIYPEVVEMLDEKLSEKFKRKPTQFDPAFEVQLNDEEVKMVETNLWDERNRILAIVDGKNMSLADFIGYLNFVPYQVIYSGIKNTLNYIFRDYLITEEAKKMDLMKEKDVILKSRVYSENLLQLELRRILVSEVNINDTDVQNYYENHKEKYKNTSFENMKDFIKELLKDERKRNVIPDLIIQLSRSLKITKDYTVIHSYYDSILKRENRTENYK